MAYTNAGTVRLLLWAGAVAVDAAGPVLATRGENRAPLHMEHLPERFGLLVILVLGDAVGGAATEVHDAGWATPSIAVGIAAGEVHARHHHLPSREAICGANGSRSAPTPTWCGSTESGSRTCYGAGVRAYEAAGKREFVRHVLNASGFELGAGLHVRR